jgi:hypothetical protein
MVVFRSKKQQILSYLVSFVTTSSFITFKTTTGSTLLKLAILLPLLSFAIISSIFLFSFHYQQQQVVAQTPISNASSFAPSSVSAKQIQNVSFIPYNNSTFGIKIAYPSNWKVSDKLENAKTRNIDVVKFYLSKEGPSFTLSTDTINKNEDQNTYLAETIQSYRHNIAGIPDFTVIKTNINDSMLAGQPGYELLYSYSRTQGSTIELLLGDEIGALIGDKVYYATYLVKISDYSIYRPIIDKMLDSLEINVPSSSFNTNEQRSGYLSEILGDAGEI